MFKLKTIEELWCDFKRICYPTGMQAEQENQLRRTFVAGMSCMLIVNERIGEDDITEAEGMKILSFYHEELGKEIARYSKPTPPLKSYTARESAD